MPNVWQRHLPAIECLKYNLQSRQLVAISGYGLPTNYSCETVPGIRSGFQAPASSSLATYPSLLLSKFCRTLVLCCFYGCIGIISQTARRLSLALAMAFLFTDRCMVDLFNTRLVLSCSQVEVHLEQSCTVTACYIM
jgi:hypothetical protein